MTILIQTKLFRPTPVPHQVVRQHVRQRLDQGLDLGRQMSLVSAPAGYGKTTCISAWVETLTSPAAWLALEPADNDPVRFFSYIIAALQQVDENLGWEIEGALRAGHLPPSEQVVASLSNDIRQLNQRFVLVIDDFHLLREPFILDVWEQLLDHWPQQLHLVLITRQDPPFPLARLRARNRLTEVRTADLRFSRAQVAHFLEKTMALSLPDTDVATLEEKTEGWPAGLLLAALAIQQTRGSHDYLIKNLNGNQQHILDYLTTEVFNQQSEATQTFLLETAILDRISGDLAHAVTGRADSQELLNSLLQANLFLYPLDNEQQWYRYQRLFLDLLRDRLQKDPLIEPRILHERASRWFAKAGMVEEAMHHALAAENQTAVIGLLETYAMDLLMQWRVQIVARWSQMIPAAWFADNLHAHFVFAWLYLFRGDTAQAVVHIERCAQLNSATMPPSQRAKWLTLQAMWLNAQGQAAASLEVTNQALDLVPTDESHVRSLIYFSQTGAYQQLDDYANAVAAFQQIIFYGRAANSLVSELLGLAGLGLMALERGQLHFAFETASKGAARLERSGMLPPISTGIFGELGQLHFEWHQLEQADFYFRRAIQVSQLSGFSEAEIYYAVIRSRLRQREGDLPAAAAEIQKAIDLVQTIGPTVVRAEVRSQQVRVYLALGHLAEAQRVLREHGFPWTNVSSFLEPNVATEFRAHGLMINSAVRVLLTQAQLQDETAHLEHGLALASRFIEVAQARTYLPLALEALLIRARIHHVRGDRESSIRDISQAFQLAEPEGFIGIFVDEGREIAALISEFQRWQTSTHPNYIARIMAAFTAIEPMAIEAGLVEPLTTRERDVLRLMAEGLKYREIGDRLFISLNTVRFYVKEIYSKLGVNNRTQALELARQHSLI